MAKNIFAVFLLLYIMCRMVRANCTVPGYYWRDFGGSIPEDAIVGGRERREHPIYVGQVFHSKSLIPAKIKANDPGAYYEYEGTEYMATQHIKILCSQLPEKFEWIETNNEEITLLNSNELIKGGFESGGISYIGRVVASGEVLIGRVSVYGNIPSNNTGGNENKFLRHPTYDVLSFNPNLQPIDDKSIVDLS